MKLLGKGMGIVIGLYFGLFLFIKYCIEKHRDNKDKMESIDNEMRMRIAREVWVEGVIDEKLEYETENSENKEEFIKMRERILKEAQVSEVPYDMVIAGILAQHMKIPGHIARWGIEPESTSGYAQKLKWIEQRKIMIWYDRELQRNGLPYPILYRTEGLIPINDDNRHLFTKRLQEVTDTKDVELGCRYFWWPMRYGAVM